MNLSGIRTQRLRNERLIGAPFSTPEECVRTLVAVQAQDYPAAKWAIGQRVRRCSDSDVEATYNSGAVLRTHVMRPTWHFVLPEDIRWLLALTAPRVKRAIAYYDRQLELDEPTLKRAHRAIEKELRKGTHLTRAELGRVITAAGIAAAGQRLAHIVMHAELDGLICSGAMRGKQHTYALLDERAPKARTMRRDESLAELSRRYFASHGPATMRDFAWWSGLTAVDVKRGIEMLGSRVAGAEVGGKTYWRVPDNGRVALKSPTVHLLPNYDEYLIAYKDREAFFDEAGAPPGSTASFYDVLSRHIVVLDGNVIGGWRSVVDKQQTFIETRLSVELKAGENGALNDAAGAYGRFTGVSARVRRWPAES